MQTQNCLQCTENTVYKPDVTPAARPLRLGALGNVTAPIFRTVLLIQNSSLPHSFTTSSCRATAHTRFPQTFIFTPSLPWVSHGNTR